MDSPNRNTSDNIKVKPSRWRLFGLLIIIIAFIATLVFVNSNIGLDWVDSYHKFPAKIRELGFLGQLSIIGLMIIHSFIPFPAEFVALAAGNAYGTVHGTILTWIGAMLGASLSFGLTRIFGHPFVSWILPIRQQKMLDKWTDDQGAMTLLVSRFIPLIAFNLINYAVGLTKISWWTFLWTTGLGILPLTALVVHMGGQMQELSWSKLIIVSIVCILTMASFHYYKRKAQK